MNSSPYSDVFNELYARLNAMIETMNKRHKHLISEMRECGLLHEIKPGLPSPRLEISVYTNHQSFLPLESNFVDDASFTFLEEAFDPPLTCLPFVALSFSRIPLDMTIADLTLLACPLSLA